MSSLNKKVIQFNSSERYNSIMIPKNDIILDKKGLMGINNKVNYLTKNLREKNKKGEITDSKRKFKIIKNNGDKNKKINDYKKSKKIELFPLIKNTDTLAIKNNNFKLFLNNYRFKFHSFDNLNNPKKKIENENKRKNNDISKNINLLSTAMKTNELYISKESDSYKSNKKISNNHNIKTFNQFFKPRFINKNQQKFINKRNNRNIKNIFNEKEKLSNLNLTQNILNTIKKIYSKNISYYKTYFKNNTDKEKFLNSSKSCITFNKQNQNNLNSLNSLIILNEDDIETFKRENNSLNSISDSSSSLENNIQIPKSDKYFFESSKKINYDYIQSPIEFEYESDITSSKNTINNENDFNKICSNLKNIEILEIQKKRTNMENDTINNYEQMIEEDNLINNNEKNELNSSIIFNRKSKSTFYLSKCFEVNSRMNNCKQIILENELIQNLKASFKRTLTNINKEKHDSFNKYKILNNKDDKIKEKGTGQMISRFKYDISIITNIVCLIKKIYLNKNKIIFINELKDSYGRNINNKYNKIQNKNKNILKNQTSIKNKNINSIEIEKDENIFNKSFNIKNKSFYYIKKIFSKSKPLNTLIKFESDRSFSTESLIKNNDKIKINKKLIFQQNNLMEAMKKNKKINKNLLKSDLTERTTDSKSLKISSYGDNEKDITNEDY